MEYRPRLALHARWNLLDDLDEPPFRQGWAWHPRSLEPTQKLVVRGVYQHVRNPMITGVCCILLGEAIFFGSLWLLGWFGIVVAVNMIYIPLAEERGLAKRFGDDYLLYKRNVPRWIPRLTPWKGLYDGP